MISTTRLHNVHVTGLVDRVSSLDPAMDRHHSFGVRIVTNDLLKCAVSIYISDMAALS